MSAVFSCGGIATTPLETSMRSIAELVEPVAQLVDAAVQPGELGQRPAEHDRHVVRAVGGELGRRGRR